MQTDKKNNDEWRRKGRKRREEKDWTFRPRANISRSAPKKIYQVKRQLTINRRDIIVEKEKVDSSKPSISESCQNMEESKVSFESQKFPHT